MNNELKVFSNEEFGNVRVEIVNGKELFCASDIAKALGYTNTSKAISDHCRCITKRYIPHPQSPNKTIETNFITEGDLYRLIAHSKLPSAEKFELWVFDEVLPSIRKHGAYMTDNVLEQAIANPDFMIGLLQNLKEEKQARLEAECKLEKAKPRLDFVDAIESTNKAIGMGDMAKLLCKNGLKIGRNNLFDKLRDMKVLMSNNIPYQKYVNNEWFEVVETVKFGKLCVTTLVLPKGQIGIVRKLLK